MKNYYLVGRVVCELLDDVDHPERSGKGLNRITAYLN